jgi:hypothetical protein
MPGYYYLDMTSDYDLDTNEGGAQFDRATQVLTITLQVLK